jgi:hypothetical protein
MVTGGVCRVVDGTGHIEEMRRVRLQEEPVPWYGFEPSSLSVAKPLHHTREPKVGSRVGVQPEFDWPDILRAGIANGQALYRRK